MATRAQVADITDSSRSSRASSSADGSSCDDSSSTSSTRANQKDVEEHQRKRPKRRARFVHSDSLSSKLYCSSTSSSNEDEDSKEGEKDERRRVRTHHRPVLNTVTPAIDSDISTSRAQNASPPDETSSSSSSTQRDTNQTSTAKVSDAQLTSTASTNQSSGEDREGQEVSDPLGLLSQSELIAAAAALSAAATPESRRRRYASGMTKERLRQERLAANRRSAHDARIRREIMVDELQQSVVELVKENAALRKRRTELRNEVIQLHETNEKLKRNHQQRKRLSDGTSAVNASSQHPPPPPAPPPPCNTPQAYAIGNSANAASMEYQTSISSEGPSNFTTAATPATGSLHGNPQQQKMAHMPNPFAQQQQPCQQQTFQQQFYQNQQLLLQQQFNAMNSPSATAAASGTVPYTNLFPFPFLFTNSLNRATTSSTSDASSNNNVLPSAIDATTALSFHRAQQLQNLCGVQDQQQQQGQLFQQQGQLTQQQGQFEQQQQGLLVQQPNQLVQQEGQLLQQQNNLAQQQGQFMQQQGQLLQQQNNLAQQQGQFMQQQGQELQQQGQGQPELQQQQFRQEGK